MIDGKKKNVLAVIASMAIAMMIMTSVGIYGTMDTRNTGKISLVEHYEVKMNFTSDVPNSSVDWATFGANETATDGFDVGLDLPQGFAPPEPYVQGYFRYPDNPPDYKKLAWSYVNLTDSMTWPLRIKLDTDDGPANVTVEWNMTDIGNWPSDYHITLETPDSDINMRAVSNYTYESLTSGNHDYDINASITGVPPVANFTWTPVEPTQEDMVQFTDLSTGTIVNWTWSFGDGHFSYEQNSTHRFTIGNVYTVNLTVKDNNNLSDSIEKDIIVDRNVSFLAGYNYFGYSLWNDTNSSALAGLLNLQTFDTIYKYNTSAGCFTGYTVGIGDPDVFNISTWDALIIKVGGGRSSRLNTTNKVNSSRNVSLTTTDGNPGYNYLCWSSYNSTNATEFATLAGLETFDTIYKYNTTSSSFIGYTVGIGDPDVFDIEPYDVIIVKVASNKEFVIP